MWKRLVEKYALFPLERRYLDPLRVRVGEAALAAQRCGRSSFQHLWDAEVSVFSQFGEDGIIDFLCESLELAKPRALEFGAGNFMECNTRFLAEHRHASVVAVDARKDLVPTMKALDLYWKTSIFPIQEWITPGTAPRMLARANKLMGAVDLISLDIDGNDFWVAETLRLDNVQVIVVEYNPLFGHQRAVTVPRDDAFDRYAAHASGLYFGASLRAWIHLLGERGYAFVGTNRVGNNAFFCPTTRVSDLRPLKRLSVVDLEPYVDWRVREGRDSSGKLTFLHGTERLRAIGDLPVHDVIHGEELTVAELGVARVGGT